MAEVRRKKGETFEGFLRRFSRRLQESGRLLQARKIRFRPPSESKSQTKRRALKRKEVQEKREYLRKTGQLEDELLDPRSQYYKKRRK